MKLLPDHTVREELFPASSLFCSLCLSRRRYFVPYSSRHSPMSAAHRAIPPCMSAPGISGQNSTPAMTMYITAVQSFPYQRAEYTFPVHCSTRAPSAARLSSRTICSPISSHAAFVRVAAQRHHGNLDELIRRRVERLAEIGHHIEAAGRSRRQARRTRRTAAARPLPARAHL